MISKDKIEKLEEITIEDFKELMGNLISFLGYTDTIVDANSITAIRESPLSSEKYMFIFYFFIFFCPKIIMLSEIKILFNN